MIAYGSLFIFVTPRGKRYIKCLHEGEDWHSNEGIVTAQTVADANFGDIVTSSLGVPIRIEEATLEDRLLGIKRQTQIIYPKDIAQICLKLGIGPRKLVIEAGCGSGGLTLAFSWYCGPAGRVVSHDAREEFIKLTRRNLEWAGVGENVELYHQDISQGFKAANADALFLDVREPWLYLGQVAAAVRPGASMAFLLPTINQVNDLIIGLESGPFVDIEINEILLRKWKLTPDRMRPMDRMVAHTGFLIFCRQGQKSQAFENYMPKGTRERKQELARQKRQQESELDE